MTSAWGYTSDAGPDTWSKQFPLAAGKHQSPIDIRPDVTRVDPALQERPLVIDYRNARTKVLLNSGASWKVEAEGGVLTGGPLLHRYVLEQFHCHWGITDATGSEHTVDGKTYPAELHMVHWNSDLYESFGAAAGASDGTGLTVLGMFIEIGEEENQSVSPLTDVLQEVTLCGQETTLTDDLDLSTLIPEDRSYWTYTGSLTTPPCYESVTWILFKNPIKLSQRQLSTFRQLRSFCEGQDCPVDQFEGYIVENYRPPQPVGGRVVRSC